MGLELPDMDAAAPPGIDYAGLLRAALLGVVREALARAAREGLPGEHHFYLTFATGAPGVVMPEAVRARFPDEMTVVLQHQFWNLDVGVEAFSVTLRFGGAPQRLTIPFDALTAFVDPSVPFGLKLTTEADADRMAQAEEPQAGPAHAGETLPPPAPAEAAPPAVADGPRGATVLAFPRAPRE